MAPVGEMFYLDGSPVAWWNADDNFNFNKSLIQPGESSTWKLQLADGQRFDQPARPGTAYVEFISVGPGNDTNAARKIRTPNFTIQ